MLETTFFSTPGLLLLPQTLVPFLAPRALDKPGGLLALVVILTDLTDNVALLRICSGIRNVDLI